MTTTLPCRVGEALRLDVARLVEVLLDEALAAAERGDRLAGGGVEQLGDLFARAGDLEAAAAAAEGRLDGDRQAVLVDEVEHLVGAGDRVQRAGSERRADLLGDVPRGDLVAERSIASGDGPIQMRPASMTARAKSAFSARKP